MQTLYYPDWETLTITERPQPEAAPDEVLLRVASCGICGSELEAFTARSPRRTPPLIMGHEFCGTVAAVGAAVEGFAVGDRVVSHSLVPCGACVRCRRGDTHLCAQRQIFGMHRMGAFADYVAAPARSLLSWPAGLPSEVACLAEPLANGVHVAGLVRHRAPRSVVVLGAGPIGLMCQQAAQVLLGAGVVVADLVPERLAVARRLGAHRTVDARTDDVVAVAREVFEGEGADLVIDAVGSAVTKRQSLAACRPGGAVVWIGLHADAVTLDTYGVTLPERTVYGTYAARMSELQEALDLMAAGRVDAQSWVHVFPLTDGVEAFHRMLAAEGDDIKAVLTP